MISAMKYLEHSCNLLDTHGWQQAFHSLQGGQILSLYNSQILYQICSGQMLVFSVQVQNKISTGYRHFLFRLSTEDVIWGASPTSSCQLIAVAVGEVKLSCATAPSLESIASNRKARHQVEEWINQLSKCLPQSIELLATQELANQDWLDKVLQQYSFTIQQIEQHQSQIAAQRIAQQQERIERDQQLTSEVLSNLASPWQSHVSLQVSSQSSALLSAAMAVGHSLGIVIHSPSELAKLNRLREPLVAIAQASGVRIRQVTLDDRWWNDNYGALLGYTTTGEPIALLPTRNRHYECFNPINQTRTLVNEQLAATLTTRAYTFYRSFPDKQLNALEVLRFAIVGQEYSLLLMLLMVLLATGIDMLVPIFSGRLVSEVLPNSQRDLLLQMGGVLLAASFGSIIFNLTKTIALLRLETVADTATESAVWDRVLRLKTGFFRHYEIGDLSSRLGAISEIRRALSGTVLTTFLSSSFALINFGLMLYYSQQLSMVAGLFTLIIFLATVLSGWLIARSTRKLLELEGKLYGTVVQLVSSVSKLRVGGAEQRAFIYWADQYRKRMRLKVSTRQISDSLGLFNGVLSPLMTIVLFWVAIHAIRPMVPGQLPTLSFSSFIAFNVAFGKFQSSFLSLSSVVVQSLNIVNLWQRVKPILNAELEVNQQKTEPGKLEGKISIDRVTFRYKADSPAILHDVSIHVEPGDFIALVGVSGSGKSTLMRLLLGFEQPETGAIYYDGQDLSKLNVQAVRRQLGVVLQNSRLMSASIFDNIAGSALITQEEAWQAVVMAGMAEDIEAMPMGLFTVVSEGGSNLSGGQRQRLLIARALALKPKILLFDEATSALDNQTQAIVSQSIEQLQVARIVIAHRLSTIQNASRIYVLDKGRIVQQGTFTELINREGLFAQLMQRQIV